MYLAINFESETPIYTQLRNQIIEGIASKRLKPGESLPSVRQLASDLGINMHTVNKAYNQLKQEGFMAIHKREGVLVVSQQQMAARPLRESLRDQLRPHIAEMICRGKDEKAIIQEIKSICQSLREGEDHE